MDFPPHVLKVTIQKVSMPSFSNTSWTLVDCSSVSLSVLDLYLDLDQKSKRESFFKWCLQVKGHSHCDLLLILKIKYMEYFLQRSSSPWHINQVVKTNNLFASFVYLAFFPQQRDTVHIDAYFKPNFFFSQNSQVVRLLFYFAILIGI